MYSHPKCQVDVPSGFNLNHLQAVGGEGSGASSVTIQQMLESAKVDLHKDMPPPPICLELTGVDGKPSIIGTLGNFSLLIGKAKSRKTFLVGILLAAVLGERLKDFRIRACLPHEQKTVLYFDTEQGVHHVQSAARRVLELSGAEASDQFRVYGLRKYSPAERLQIIEHAIRNTPNLGFVVIDGIRDLVTSINDEEEATMLSSKLLKWSEELNIHILCVLHQNKADNNARGHLGTELQNKAESVLSVSKSSGNKEMSVVAAEYCRGKDFEPFAFKIDDSGLPRPVENWEEQKKQSKKSVRPEELAPDVHTKVLDEVFATQPTYNFTPFYKAIQSALSNIQIIIGESAAKKFVPYYMGTSAVVKEGKSGSPTAIYKRAKPPV